MLKICVAAAAILMFSNGANAIVFQEEDKATARNKTINEYSNGINEKRWSVRGVAFTIIDDVTMAGMMFANPEGDYLDIHYFQCFVYGSPGASKDVKWGCKDITPSHR